MWEYKVGKFCVLLKKSELLISYFPVLGQVNVNGEGTEWVARSKNAPTLKTRKL